MSEELLKAILRLFALIAKIDGISEKERGKIEIFLFNRLNQESAGKYMLFFDQQAFNRKGGKRDNRDPEHEMGQIRDLSIMINIELTTQQKFIVMLELIQLVYADKILSDLEDHALDIIRESFYISQRELKDIKTFVTGERIEDFDLDPILIISGEDEGIPDKCKRIISNSFEGFLAVLNLTSIKPFFVRFLGSSVVYLNYAPLESGAIMVMPAGSTLRNDKFNTIYYSDLLSQFKADDNKVRVSIRVEHISYKFGNGQYGLRDISLHETHGRLIGIMGASGSGKSTLFNVLNGNESPVGGKVFINGIDIHRDEELIQGLIGYVPQDDALIEDLTVYENLYFNARLCFSHYSSKELTKLINRILANLGLYEVRNLKVGSPLNKMISGGQRKRLNIGLELLREPPVMFIDEPTSGLSSRDSENIMDLLKELTLRGKLIFVIIHQPSSDIFKMFDQLLVLDVGGYLIYYGNPLESVVYFNEAFNLVESDKGTCQVCGDINPEQIFNIVESRVVDEYGRPTSQRKITPQTWNNIYLEQTKAIEKEEFVDRPEVIMNIPGRAKQAKIFVLRDIRAKMSNRQYVLINLFEAPVLAMILAVLVKYYPRDALHQGIYIFQENMNIPAYIFMAVVVALFMGLTVSAEEIIKDRKILKRESFLNLSRGSYLFSKLMILLLLSAFQTMSFILVGNIILSIKGLFMEYWLVLFSISFFANVLGLNISSAFNSAITIYILIPILLIPQILLSGVVVQFDQLNPAFGAQARVPLIGDVMVSRWAYEALMVTQYKDNAFEKQFYDVDRRIANADYMTVYYLPVLESMLDFLFINNDTEDELVRSSREQQSVVLKNEIRKELQKVGEDKFTKIDSLNCDRLSQHLYNELSEFLKSLKNMYHVRQKNARDEKETRIAKMCDSPEDIKNYQTMIRDYTNDQVASLVLDKMDATRILENGGRLFQKVYPVYIEPEPRGFFDYRTLFYAPVKYFAGRYYGVLPFNIAVIWIMTFLLIITLYFDLLSKFIHIGRKNAREK